MNLEKLRPQFQICLMLDTVEVTSEINVHLLAAGFNVQAFIEFETLLSHIKQKPPHLIVAHERIFSTGIESFFKEVLTLHPEVAFVIVSQRGSRLNLSEFYEFNLWEHLVIEERSWDVLAAALNRFIKFQSMVYLNETLALDNQALNKKLQEIDSRTRQPRISFSDILQDYQKLTSSGAKIDHFFLRLGGSSSRVEGGVFYFSFIESTRTFLLTHFYNSQANLNEFVSHWPQMTERDLAHYVQKNQLPDFFISTFEALGIEGVQHHYLRQDGVLCGALVWQNSLAQDIDFSEEVKGIEFALQIFNSQGLATRLEESLSEPSFKEQLEIEAARSLRIQTPLALLRLSARVDSSELQWLPDMEKSFFKFLKKWLRPYDFFCKVQGGEYLIALPHCEIKDSLALAERIKLSLIKHAELKWHCALRMEVAVTSFPNLSSSTEEALKQTNQLLGRLQVVGASTVAVFRNEVPPV